MDTSSIFLIEKCRKGDRNAQLFLYERHSRRLYFACLRILGNSDEAEEAMQDAFLKIFTRIDQYTQEMCFEAWSQRIAIRTAIDYIRAKKEECVLLSNDGVAGIEDEDEQNEDDILYFVQKIKNALVLLPAGYRIVLSLYLFEGYDMEEISSILKIKPVSVRTQYLRAKKKLLELMPNI
ncbi:MAG: sigma-70 family RNA polymerase sigma factor [Bacteroidales bacterium]|nr:sigma-70 family RNA polymerase sigma factor [Bacteroidales bacterium]